MLSRRPVHMLHHIGYVNRVARAYRTLLKRIMAISRSQYLASFALKHELRLGTLLVYDLARHANTFHLHTVRCLVVR